MVTGTMAGVVSVTAVNTGRRPIILLDEFSVTLIKTVVLDLISHIASTSESCSVDSVTGPSLPQPQAFRFDDDTPNVAGKVAWDPARDGWKMSVTQNGKSQTLYKDHDGVSLTLTSECSRDETKRKLYWRAIRSWNRLDTSKRHRIAVPVHLEVASDDSQDAPGSTMTIKEKWNADEGL